MTTLKEDYICPNCKKKNRIKIKYELTNDDIFSIIDKSLFKVDCKNCNNSIYIEYPFKITGDNYIIYYTLDNKNEIIDSFKDIMRVCHFLDDVREKLMIINDDLNDIVLEFIKDFLITQLDPDLKNDTTMIRYDGMNEENLIFYLLGSKKSIGCSKEFYQSILDRSKIKKIKKCTLIDKSTYHKYFKLK